MQTHAKNIKYFYKQKHAKRANAASCCVNEWHLTFTNDRFISEITVTDCLSFNVSCLSYIRADFNGGVIKKLACQNSTSEQ